MALRWAVFVEEQGVPPEDELDGTDEGAIHVLALRDGMACGAARFHLKDGVAKIGRVCVSASARGQGLGAALIRFVLQHAATIPDIRLARLGAQTSALSFYQALGFVATGPEYMDAGIPHQDMEKSLV